MPARIVIVADHAMLRARAALLGSSVRIVDFTPDVATRPGEIGCLHVPLARAAAPGILEAANSAYVLRTLEIAADGCMDETFCAMATAPVHKGIINDAGFAFTGHTEFLAERTRAPHVVMMLVGGGMRVALATTHVALSGVAARITQESLERTLHVLHADLVSKFGIARPRIIVAGLNPHAGEGGHLGREEIDVIEPVLDRLRAAGMDLRGPLPADTLFQPHRLQDCDSVLAMYHDQGLPVLKYASFGAGVNVTLGLPIIRTSVDHGTALDLAGTGRAESGSLAAAVNLAATLADRARDASLAD